MESQLSVINRQKHFLYNLKQKYAQLMTSSSNVFFIAACRIVRYFRRKYFRKQSEYEGLYTWRCNIDGDQKIYDLRVIGPYLCENSELYEYEDLSPSHIDSIRKGWTKINSAEPTGMIFIQNMEYQRSLCADSKDHFIKQICLQYLIKKVKHLYQLTPVDVSSILELIYLDDIENDRRQFVPVKISIFDLKDEYTKVVTDYLCIKNILENLNSGFKYPNWVNIDMDYIQTVYKRLRHEISNIIDQIMIKLNNKILPKFYEADEQEFVEEEIPKEEIPEEEIPEEENPEEEFPKEEISEEKILTFECNMCHNPILMEDKIPFEDELDLCQQCANIICN